MSKRQFVARSLIVLLVLLVVAYLYVLSPLAIWQEYHDPSALWFWYGFWVGAPLLGLVACWAADNV